MAFTFHVDNPQPSQPPSHRSGVPSLAVAVAAFDSTYSKWRAASQKRYFTRGSRPLVAILRQGSEGPVPDRHRTDEPQLPSLCLWKSGHRRPPLCIEIVSLTHPNKDYRNLHERYALMHAAEVVVFDPLLAGPKSLGGPAQLQLWRRSAEGLFERTAFGNEPAYCEYLDAWFVPEGQLLDIAEDRKGQHLWQGAAERERAEKERERAARIDLEQRLAALEQAAK